MLPRFDELSLTDSAYHHGFDDEDAAEVLERKCFVIRNRRGKLLGYEIFGRNLQGAYLLRAARVIEFKDRTMLRVFHVDRMTDDERKRYLRHVKR